GPRPRAVRLGRDTGGGRRGGDRARGDRDDRLADARRRPVGAGDPGGAAPPPLRPQARGDGVLRPAAEGRGRRMSYAVGLDFGTESGRAVLVDLATGAELATVIHEYANGVIDRHLLPPDEYVVLEPDWALQDPDDYIATIRATIPGLLAETGVDPVDVVGLGIDFTACTMLPTTADGTPLSRVPELRREPHAWGKLWKHHTAQPEADPMHETALDRGEPWLPRYGGRISSEWFYSKGLQ